MIDPATSVVVPHPESKPPTQDWSEEVWLDRLSAAVAAERRAYSPITHALPSMLVALGWPGTGRNLAASLPPARVALSLALLEQLLSDLGFKSRRLTAKGNASDTARLRAGSLVLSDGAAAVYLGQPYGEDLWLIDGRHASLLLQPGDTILSIEPDLGFQPVDEPQYHWFRTLFERMRNELFALLAMSGLINVFALSVSLYIMVIYRTVIPSGTAQTIANIALLASVAVIGGWALRVGRQRVMVRMGSWAGMCIGGAAIRKMLSFPLDGLARLGIQSNVVRMRSFESARQFLSGPGGTHLIDCPYVALFVLVIGLMGGWLVLVPIVALLCFAALAFPIADYVSSKAAAAAQASGRLEEHAGGALLGIDTFYDTGAGNRWLNQLVDYARESAARNSDYAVSVARAQLIGHALSELTVLATLGAGILLVLGDAMDAAGLVASMILIWRVVAPAQEGFSALVRLRQVRNSIHQLDELMATPAEHPSVDIVSPVGFAGATVTVERLYYRPGTDQEAALNGVVFSVPAGTRTAIVGPNSGGKTLLLECLSGLRQPQAGRILVNGCDIRQFDPVEYRAWVGYVPQLVPALPMTVLEYMRLRAPALQDECALLEFERVLGARWQDIPVFLGLGDELLDRELRPLSQDTAEIRLRYIVNFVAATIGAPPLLLLDGAGLGANPWWEDRITTYLDSIRGQTTVIWAAYSAEHIQSCDQLVLLDHGNVRHAGPTARAAAKAG